MFVSLYFCPWLSAIKLPSAQVLPVEQDQRSTKVSPTITYMLVTEFITHAHQALAEMCTRVNVCVYIR